MSTTFERQTTSNPFDLAEDRMLSLLLDVAFNSAALKAATDEILASVGVLAFAGQTAAEIGKRYGRASRLIDLARAWATTNQDLELAGQMSKAVEKLTFASNALIQPISLEAPTLPSAAHMLQPKRD
jgi:hypothetical protein